jgi:hypothetical protein
MQILPAHGIPYIIDNLSSPIMVKHNWIFQGSLLDFSLQPIHYLEETTGACVKIRINNLDFWVPSSWYILICDPHTFQIETIAITKCSGINFSAYAFSPHDINLRLLDIMVVDYADNMSVVHPMINKGTMMMHPVGPAIRGKGRDMDENHLAVAIGPFDLSKSLSGKIIGDLLSW